MLKNHPNFNVSSNFFKVHNKPRKRKKKTIKFIPFKVSSFFLFKKFVRKSFQFPYLFPLPSPPPPKNK